MDIKWLAKCNKTYRFLWHKCYVICDQPTMVDIVSKQMTTSHKPDGQVGLVCTDQQLINRYSTSHVEDVDVDRTIPQPTPNKENLYQVGAPYYINLAVIHPPRPTPSIWWPMNHLHCSPCHWLMAPVHPKLVASTFQSPTL